MNEIHVFKFGGASVKDAQAIKNVCQIIDQFTHFKLVIVVSAMGKTTNALEEVVSLFFDRKSEAITKLKNIYDSHRKVLTELISDMSAQEVIAQKLEKHFSDVNNFIKTSTSTNYDLVYDQVVSLGELVSTTLVASYLNAHSKPTHWLDARSCIRTDSTYREGRVDWQFSQKCIDEQVTPHLRNQSLVVTQGFIASTESGFTTTLGREGSDYSAAIFSYCLNAEEMSIWKDVPGILTADPKLFTNVQKIDHLSYKEATEMTYYGAKVIHPKTIKPLQNKNIPLHVKAFANPQGIGTIISNNVEVNYPPVIVIEKNQIMLHISTRDFSFVAEHHLADLFEIFAFFRFKVNLMRNTAISFSVCLTNKERSLHKLVSKLNENYNVVVDKHLELITIRHYTQSLINEMKGDKIVLLEERIPKTIQMVVKDIPQMKRISQP